MYISRILEKEILDLSAKYPVVTITGPRQSGKTTLCQKIFPEKKYLSLEDPNVRDFALNDPIEFLNQDSKGLVIDEIQRVPELMSFIQTIVDREQKKSMYILTGSQQFELMSSLTQSLAGRTALVRVLPFSYSEVYKDSIPALNDVLYKGLYPKIHDQDLNPTKELSFYVNTYIERDIRLITNIKSLKTFETFLRICAGRTAQILNYANIANDVGIDIKTVKHWLSILETSFIIRILPPYYKNMNKRLVKSPKLYFLDTGLVCYLLGIKKSEQLTSHPLIGALFETFVISELYKKFYNKVENDNLYYYRDHRGNEVDIIFDNVVSINQLEIKLSKTPMNHFFKGLDFLKRQNDYKIDKSFLVYGGDESYKRNNVQLVSWRDIHLF